MDWLENYNTMQCDWLQKKISFIHNGQMVTLQGVVPQPEEHVKEISAEQLLKLQKGNDLWALVILSQPADNSIHQEQYSSIELPSQIKEIIHEFQELFKTPDELPPNRTYDRAISLLPDVVPINCRPYRYSPQQKDEIERQVANMLQAGLIAPSISPFASPILLVKKKDGSWKFCVDYRKLNVMTIKNKFPMAVIDEFLDEIAGAAYFSKLDLSSGFHQIRMVQKDEHKTAFKTHSGHYQFRVMPFGLTNAPATFQCLMNSVFAPYIKKFVLVFMDDILIYSRSLQEHVHHLRVVFQVLVNHKLFLKFNKCAFAQQQVEYLGHVISDKGVATGPSKTEVMVKWPTPQSLTEVRGFLGLTRYYRKFVKHYGIIANPLTGLLKCKTFSWSQEAKVAF
jgi:hypothetical protein